MEQDTNIIEDDDNSNTITITITTSTSSTTPKLSLYSLPSQHSELGSESPPLRRASASVPFLWEEAPGKPRRCSAETDSEEITYKSLGLPPRLVKFTNMPSPTTVLDGPDVGRTLSFRVSPESRRGIGNKFGSNRWGSFRWGGNKAVFGGSFDISSEGGIDETDGSQSEDHHHSHYKVSRRANPNNHHIKSSPHLLASIYESFKQAVPWRRKQEKQRKMRAS